MLALAVAIPAAAILVFGTVRAWDLGRDATDRALTARADALALAVGRVLDLSRATLEVLATSPHLDNDDLVSFRTQIDQVPRPQGARIVLTDESGQIVVNSLFPPGTPLSRTHDTDLIGRVFASGKPQVSGFYTGPMPREALVALDVPVRDLDGQVRYALRIAFTPDVLGRVLSEQRLPPNWVATLVDRRGFILARSRNGDRFVGQRVNSHALDTLSGQKNLFVTQAQEGETVRGARAIVQWADWTAVVFVPQSELDAPLWRSLLLASATGGGLLLLGLISAAWQARRIARPLGALAAGAAALGQGHVLPPVPRGIREATQVEAALGQAAAMLVRRDKERDENERRRGLLTAELNHRVKNALATVQATAAQTLRIAGDDPPRFVDDFNARLRALARAHDLLTANDWEGAELGAVVRIALSPWLSGTMGAEGGMLIDCSEADAAALRPQQAHALVLALHELATNAARHGALSRTGGRVVVRCRRAAENTAVLEWQEAGGPKLAGPPSRRGFGTRLLERGLARDLGPDAAVSLFFEAGGLRAFMHFAVRAASWSAA